MDGLLMETKQIINGLLDMADRVADQSAGRIMKQAAKRLEELDQEQKWIPVTERLPTAEDGNEDGEVLVYHPSSGLYEGMYWNDVSIHRKLLSHWMPLPEAPKEVDHES